MGGKGSGEWGWADGAVWAAGWAWWAVARLVRGAAAVVGTLVGKPTTPEPPESTSPSPGDDDPLDECDLKTARSMSLDCPTEPDTARSSGPRPGQSRSWEESLEDNVTHSASEPGPIRVSSSSSVTSLKSGLLRFKDSVAVLAVPKDQQKPYRPQRKRHVPHPDRRGKPREAICRMGGHLLFPSSARKRKPPAVRVSKSEGALPDGLASAYFYVPPNSPNPSAPSPRSDSVPKSAKDDSQSS